VIIDNYHKQKQGRARLMVTEAQSRWITYQKALYAKRSFFHQTNVHRLPPTRQHLIRITSSPLFENFIMACIIMNTLVLGLVIYPRPSDAYMVVLDRLNILFAIIFNMEALLKLCAMHMAYFKESWNVFDFACVFVNDVFVVLEAAADGDVQVASVIKGIRIFRIARLFRLVRFLKGLNQLTMAFILSVPKLANVGFIMLLLIYLFAVLGVNLFAEVGYIDGGSYNDYANFRTFWTAMSLLIRSMTGEGWNAIMHDLSKDKFYYESYLNVQCVEGLSVTAANFHLLDADGDGAVDPERINGCGKQEWAFAFFITYTLIVTFVILNLFIAVIFEGFEESCKSEVADLLQTCVEAWRRYDPDNTMFVSLERALDFIDEVVDQVSCYKGDADNGRNPLLDSRWDHTYCGMSCDTSPLALYNLRYMRITGLQVTPLNEVRFVVAVKAVVRRIICQGGLDDIELPTECRLRRLRELEELDRLMEMESPSCAKSLGNELRKLRRKEKKQARAIGSMLRLERAVSSSLSSKMAPSLFQPPLTTSVSCFTTSSENGEPNRCECSMLHEVAAAKIQRRFKEALQRRRDRIRRTRIRRSSGGSSQIPRAAG